MKKIIMLTLVVVLIAGGAYRFLMGTDASTSFKISQYLPESVNSFFQLEGDVVNSDGTVIETDLATTSESPFADPVETQADNPDDTGVADLKNTGVEIEQNNQKNANSVEAEVASDTPIEVATEESNSEKKLQEDVKTLAESVTETAITEQQALNQEAETTQQPVTNPEVVKLEQKLTQLKASISQFDNENEALQQKFKQMLQQNKELATRLNKLNTQLHASN